MNKNIKISQYADDTSLFLDGSQKSFETCIRTILEYAKYSGLAMNFQKTKVIWIGCRNDQNPIFLPHLNLEWNPSTFNILGIEFTTDLVNITDRNIEAKLIEMQRAINSWSKRDLTPFGKIVVIRTLIISKIVHILISLPTPSNKIMLKINKMLYDFLWDGKPDKIKRTIGKQKLENGGLNMIDIYIFDKALKVTWIRRILRGQQSWKSVINEMYPDLKVFQSYGDIFVKNICKSLNNNFWRDVMKYLLELMHKISTSTLDEVCATSFLYNSKYKIDNKVIENPILKNNGIHFISQLMNEDAFLTCDQFNQKYDLHLDFLTHHAIVRCILRNSKFEELEEGKKLVKHQPVYQIILKDKKGAHTIYQTFLDSAQECKGKSKWTQTVAISDEDWIGSFMLLKRTTKDTKLRWLQFRITHSILTTNRSVSKFKNEQSHLCTFCNRASETIQHLLWQCDIVQSFWNKLIEIINKRCKHSHELKLDETLVLFGVSEFIFTDTVLGLILLSSKLYIYKCKVQGTELNLKIFMKELFNRYCVEKIVRKNSVQFKNDWGPYLDLFKSII